MQASRTWLLLASSVMVLSLLSACNSPTTPQEQSAGKRSLDPVNHAEVVPDRNDDVIDRGASPLEDRDDLMGRNQNPNLVIEHPDVVNKGADIRNMRMMAERVDGVENARITLNGGRAYITLDLIPNVTADQARAIERQVIAALKQKVPRYDFYVTSNDGYHR